MEQGVEQVFFVFEMPVERAAGYAGFLGNFLQRGAGYAVALEYFQRRVQQVLAGFLGFDFGFAHGGLWCLVKKLRNGKD